MDWECLLCGVFSDKYAANCVGCGEDRERAANAHIKIMTSCDEVSRRVNPNTALI
jgi:hypothetical protein